MTLSTFKSLIVATSLLTIHATYAANTTHNTQTIHAHKAVSYNLVGLQYVNQNLDKYDCNQDGLQLNGSVDLNGEWFALGKFTDVSGDHHCGSQNIQLGAGYHTEFNKKFDIYGNIRYEDISVDYGDGDSGIIAAVGFRGFIAHKIEVNAEVAQHTAFDGNTELNGGIAYWFDKQFAATADISLGSDTTSIAIGLRLNF